MIIDLHWHSHHSSDGRHAIADLLDHYGPGSIVSLTDHETISGWETFVRSSRERRLVPVRGLEWFSVGCHILSYFRGPPPQAFLAFMTARRATERMCMKILHAEFADRHPALPSYDAVLSTRAHPEGILGIPALADSLSGATSIPLANALGLIRERKRRLPDEQRPVPFYPSELIDRIHLWSGTPVLAHPYARLGRERGRHTPVEVERLVRDLVASGLEGLEVISGGSSPQETEHLEALCAEHDLLPTIGSDHHHAGKGRHPSELPAPNPRIREKIAVWLGL